LEAMDLGHRRLRCEAAWAVASLGDSRGTKELIQLSEEPVARLRVLAYAEELGILDQIPAEHQSLVARAEAELVVWLSEPAQMGLAPTSIELLDQREMAWPGFEDQQTCFLFRFSYNLGRGDYSNIGMSGPIALAATVDLLDMPPEEIYALFAGVHSRHEEIQEQPVEELASGYAPEIARLERRLKDEGLDNIEPRIFGLFFGDKTLVADAGKLGKPGIAVTDRVDVFWFPAQQKERAFTAADVYSLYKGRKLLRAFNPTDSHLDAHSTDATDDST
ncbi:MAG: HEAT repeat domain-containing protein, partial [Planctomycetota bacterium]|nr:HEAT repeat domain-containing protein [Planctomycetota bacterium]